MKLEEVELWCARYGTPQDKRVGAFIAEHRVQLRAWLAQWGGGLTADSKDDLFQNTMLAVVEAVVAMSAPADASVPMQEMNSARALRNIQAAMARGSRSANSWLTRAILRDPELLNTDRFRGV